MDKHPMDIIEFEVIPPSFAIRALVIDNPRITRLKIAQPKALLVDALDISDTSIVTIDIRPLPITHLYCRPNINVVAAGYQMVHRRALRADEYNAVEVKTVGVLKVNRGHVGLNVRKGLSVGGAL